mmetsp:Transcript_8338/g.26024  ORF Transcript_8338/g.26024 Transcript_8338/m.26024 type:complete len:224 (-) Transcript_8338:509-1180(-)
MRWRLLLMLLRLRGPPHRRRRHPGAGGERWWRRRRIIVPSDAVETAAAQRARRRRHQPPVEAPPVEAVPARELAAARGELLQADGAVAGQRVAAHFRDPVEHRLRAAEVRIARRGEPQALQHQELHVDRRRVGRRRRGVAAMRLAVAHGLERYEQVRDRFDEAHKQHRRVVPLRRLAPGGVGDGDPEQEADFEEGGDEGAEAVGQQHRVRRVVAERVGEPIRA